MLPNDSEIATSEGGCNAPLTAQMWVIYLLVKVARGSVIALFVNAVYFFVRLAIDTLAWAFRHGSQGAASASSNTKASPWRAPFSLFVRQAGGR